ncbi:hypothetical protein OAL67_00585 [bacterium]|nr:hypothetical protein [bacterium]
MTHTEKVLFLILFLVTVSLRFINLGYSDYISDEPGTFFYRGGKKNPEMSVSEFILSQRKGPLQLFVGYVPYSIVGNYDNELAQRIPFTLFNIGAVIIFYFLIKKLTGNYWVAFFSAFLFSTNGLITAFGRVAQYQSLNLFFSFGALYFFSDLLFEGRDHVKSTLLGTLMFCLSFLAHWDAVYILIPIFFIVLKSGKFKLALYNVILALLFLAPFMVPYILRMQALPENISYAQSRIGFLNPFLDRQNLFRFYLYNPFLTLPVYLVGGVLGLVQIKKKMDHSYIFLFWFVGVLLVFRFFIEYTGSHFYNIFVPATVLAGLGIYYVCTLLKPLLLRIPIFVLVTAILGFLFYQTYILFVDHKLEYPWQREKILVWETRKYTHEDEMRHKIGFTHGRKWKEINEFVNEQNKLNGENFGYFTNEYPQVAKYYMDTVFRGGEGGFYAIGVKRPQSFSNDYKFPQIKGKHTVHKIYNEEGNSIVRIYRVAENED